MAKKLRCTFEMAIDVQFDNPDAAEEYFIRGEWRNVFYRFDSLKELAEHLAFAFHEENDQWDGKAQALCRVMEGYGRYLKQADGAYQLDANCLAEIGTMITVTYESELDNAGTYEV